MRVKQTGKMGQISVAIAKTSITRPQLSKRVTYVSDIKDILYLSFWFETEH